MFTNDAKNFINLIDLKFSVATLIMIVLFVSTCYLIYIMAKTLKKRREAIRIKLPDIDNQHGITLSSEPQFKSNDEIQVELIDSDDDVIYGEDNKDENDNFLQTLSMETKVLFQETEEIINMPKVGEMDYEQIIKEKKKKVEEIKQKREQEAISHLRELAKADSEDNFI